MTTAVCYCPTVSHAIYHLRCQEYMDLIELSRLRCMICCRSGHLLDDSRRDRLEIDHDYAVGGAAVRGLVCKSCNLRLRYVDIGRRAATDREALYLAKPFYLGVPKSGTCPAWCASRLHGKSLNDADLSTRYPARIPSGKPRGYVAQDRFLWTMTDTLARELGGEVSGDMQSVEPVWRIWNSAMMYALYGNAGRPERAEKKREAGQ